MNSLPSKHDLFIVDMDAGKYLLYEPLKRSAAVINKRAADVVARYVENEAEIFNPVEQGILDDLKRANFLGDEVSQPPAFPTDYGFHPYEVTLFLTSRCNLRCRYCYAEGGTRAEELSWEESKAAIDYTIDNALSVGRKNFILGFHGGGEPTLAWTMMTRCVDYAKELGQKNGLLVDVHTATNGVLNNTQREYMVKNFTGINVSFDGPKDIQDHNRPFANGKGSFDQVFESLKYFDEKRFNFSIRVTVSNTSVNRMEEIVDFLGTSLPSLGEIHIEPLWLCGRCHTSGEMPPESGEFITHFTKAEKKAIELGVQLRYSGARLRTITNRFCGAPGEGFSIIPGGIVTSCYEVCSADDPKSELYHYGHYDHTDVKYHFDQKKIDRLRKLSVENIDFCSDCFCKWHCAGDCLSKSLQEFSPKSHKGSVRCEINRELTLRQIKNMINGNQ